MAQAAVLSAPIAHVGFDKDYATAIHALYSAPQNTSSPAIMIAGRNHPRGEDSAWGASSLPTPPPETGIELADDFSGSAADVPFSGIEGLPALASGPAEDLTRLKILQAALKAEVKEDDAERAFFVADLSKVYDQFVRWRKNLPNVEPFYAIKCNPDPYVLRLLAALGTGFDCASHGEIKQVLDLGLPLDPSSSIIFANPCKSISFIRSAAKMGVNMMTFDNTDELHKIARINHKAQLVVRILTDDSKSLCRLGLKFGAPLASVPHLLATARSLGLDVIGVSFHVGSGCFDPNAYSDAISRAARAFEMGAEAGYKFRLLDVGGGFESGNFEAMAKVLSDAIDVWFPKSRLEREGIRVIAEPGRYFVAEAFQLAANVIARRVSPTAKEESKSEDGMEMDDVPPSPVSSVAPVNEENTAAEAQPSVMYYINDGVYGAFNCIMFDHQKVTPYPLTLGRSPAPSTGVDRYAAALSSVWGPTCDSIDCVAPLCMLPTALDVGDWLGFDQMGAYTICAASNFNGFEKSDVHYTSGADAFKSAAVRRALSRYATTDAIEEEDGDEGW